MLLHGTEHTTPASTYRGVHDALTRHRGPARGRPCEGPGCDRTATGWMRVGPPTHIGRNSHGKRVKWSTDMDAYLPGCARCNARADHGGSLIYCPRKHVRAIWGTTPRGECRGCVRERRRTSDRSAS
jgi:hypothetical protein